MFAGVSLFLAAVAPAVTARQVQSDDYIDRIVCVSGSVAQVVRDEIDDDFNWIVLATPDGEICAATHKNSYPIDALGKLTDAEVEIRGVVRPFTSWRRFLGNQLMLPSGTPAVSVLKAPPANPFSVPDLGDDTSIHRRKAHGQVIAATREHFFLRTDNRSIMRVSPATPLSMPSIGSAVTVSGFPKPGQSTRRLDNAVWRTESLQSAHPETAESVSNGVLFARSGNRRYANNLLCGKIIKLTGTVELTSPTDSAFSRTFLLRCDEANIKVDLSGPDVREIEPPSKGSIVEVAGLCYAAFSSAYGNPAFPRLEGFTLIPRNAGDIRILKPTSWWTPVRLLAVICILTTMLGLAIAWVIALRIVSARRARALVREQLASARAELKVEERTSLAVELHDTLSQVLTGVALQIDAATGAEGGSARKFLSTARNMLSSCRQELNGCLWDLRSRTFEEKDMTEAVQRTLAPHLGSAALTVRFNVPREKLSETTAHAVLRIIRELCTNAVKHGHAKNVRVAGEIHGDVISFSVLDDGCGFDPDAAPGPAQGHFGLQGVRERLNDFNGTIRCDSAPGKGAKFTVVLHTPTKETE